MDLVLISPYSRPDPASADSKIPRLLEKRFLDLGHGAQLLTRTRVPIIKFCERPTPGLMETLRGEREKWENYMSSMTAKTDRATDASEAVSVDTEKTLVESVAGTASTSAAPDEVISANEEDSHEDLVHMYRRAIKDGWYDDSERTLIEQFTQLVDQHRDDPDSTQLLEARQKLKDLPDVLKAYRRKQGFQAARLEFPKLGVGNHCDINFSNHLALHNTLLLRCYCHCDPRVRDMVLFVKAWAKRRKINSPYHGTLSSYGYVLMVLHYLVNVATPPVVPNLQLSWKPPRQGSWEAPREDTIVDGYDVRFWRSEVEIKAAAAKGLLTSNKESVGSLLRGFFGYFAHQGSHIQWGGFSWGMDVLSLRTRGGLLSKQSKGWVAAKTDTMESAVPGQDIKAIRQRYLFAIEDPFEHEHNIARTVVHHGIVAIRDEFRRTFAMIQRVGKGAGVVEELFAEAEDRTDLQRKRVSPTKIPSKEQTGGQSQINTVREEKREHSSQNVSVEPDIITDANTSVMA